MITESDFKSFIATLPDCEVLPVSTRTGQQRADFLLNTRHIVADLKCLEDDSSSKVGKLLHERGIIFYGTRRLDSLIGGLPDEKQLNTKAFNLVTTSLESHFRHANKQIKSTIREFHLTSALGLVIVVNNGNLALEPHVVTKAIGRLMMKQFKGKTKFSAIHGCLYLCQNHEVRKKRLPGTKLFPALNIVATGGQPYDALSEYIDELIRKWCAFRGIGYLDGKTDTSIL